MYYFTFITDITERKKALDALAVSEQKYRQLHESMRDAFVLVNMQGKIIDCNQLYVDMLGYPQETLMKTTYKDLTPEKWHDFEADIVRNQVIPSGYSEVYEKEYKRADSTVFPVELKTFLIRDKDSQPAGMWAIVRDITQRKKELGELTHHREHLASLVNEKTADLIKIQQNLMVVLDELGVKNQKLLEQNEKLAKLDRMKSMFIATMSHEFRTPLNSIIGFSSILKDEWLGQLNPEQKQEVDCILRSGKHLLGLINDVIDISKIEAGTLNAQLSDFMLQKVIKETLMVLEPKASAKRLKLEISEIDTELHTDERRLHQVILNLMDNAIKFTDAGTVSLRITYFDDSIEICVKDTGIGIEQEKIQGLFKPFTRLHSAFSSQYPGTGLGLYLSKKIAEEVLGGTLNVTSKVGEGSCFCLKLPRRINK